VPPSVAGCLSPVGLLAGRPICPLALRGWAARALTRAFAGRAARWAADRTVGAPGAGLGARLRWSGCSLGGRPVPLMAGSRSRGTSSAVGLLAGRTCRLRMPLHRMLRPGWPRSRVPLGPTFDVPRPLLAGPVWWAVPAIHRLSRRMRATARRASRSPVGDRAREPHARTPSGGSFSMYRVPPDSRLRERRLRERRRLERREPSPTSTRFG